MLRPDRNHFAVSLANELRLAASMPRPPAAAEEPATPSSPLLEYDFGQIEASACLGSSSWD